MPRKKAEPAPLAALANPPEGTTAAENMRVPGPDENTPDNDLIAEEIRIGDFCEQQAKAFAEFLKPHKARQAAIQAELLSRLFARKADNTSCDAGTAYRSDILNVKIDVEGTEAYQRKNEDGSLASTSEGRDAFLDYALDNWETFGQDGLLVNAQKDAVRKHIEEHGKPPPGIKISYFTRVNIRRS